MTADNKLKITILGARGSIPTEGEDMLEFGGATSCVLVETDDNAIFLDAGTGIRNAPDVGDKEISIFLTHPHLDHILGLPFFPYITHKDRQIDFYAAKTSAFSAKEQLDAFFAPPLWPCEVEGYPACFIIHDIDSEAGITIGDIKVTNMPSVHPGGGSVYRISRRGRSLVYATDYEYTKEKVGELIDFSKDTDLLLMDAQYTEEEFAKRIGFGHSTVNQGMEIMEKSGAKTIRFVHHDPRHDDEFLRRMEAEVKSETVAFARIREVIYL